MNKGFAVAIDGPVASGKGTIASALARKLSGSFINTGAMYRCVALLCLERGIDTSNEPLVNNILPEVNVVFNKEQVLLNGKDITERIKEPDIAALAALVASYAGVRKDLVVKQQGIANDEKKKGNIVIMEGRDIGTRVIPDADLKIFLTADPNVRARRRLEQFAEKGIEKEIDEVMSETLNRDKLDSEREVDPLPSNPASLGYFVLDNSTQSETESVSVILEQLKSKGLINDSL